MDTDDLSYFHGKITRLDAEKLLGAGGDGKFLTRVSTSSHGDYVLSVVCGTACLHFQIKSQGEVCSVYVGMDNKRLCMIELGWGGVGVGVELVFA